MELYRITQEIYADDLSGNGSRLFGGRWNSEGIFALYTSTTRALALLETLAHTPAKMLQIKSYTLLTLSLPDSATSSEIVINDLPANWATPDNAVLTQKIGDSFFKTKKTLLLQVPSVVMPEEKNIIINPLHSDYKKLHIKHKRVIKFDSRIATNF